MERVAEIWNRVDTSLFTCDTRPSGDTALTGVHSVFIALSMLDLRPGQSFLNVDAETGLVNEVAAHLLGPGCLNVGLTSTALLSRFRSTTGLIRRANPTLESTTSRPIFIDQDDQAINTVRRRYDRILVLGSFPEVEQISRLLQFLNPNGRLVTWTSSCTLMAFKLKDGGRFGMRIIIDKAMGRYLRQSMPLANNGLYSHLFSEYSISIPNQDPPSLATVAMRSLIRLPEHDRLDAMEPNAYVNKILDEFPDHTRERLLSSIDIGSCFQ